MSELKFRCLVVIHDSENKPGLVGEYLAESGFEIDEHVVTPDDEAPNVANEFPPFDLYDLIVLMGSIRSLTQKAEIDSWVYTELDLIREANTSGIPILGICFGGQLIAEALGGSVELAPIPEVGWYEIHGNTNPAGSGPWKQWHYDRFTPPPDAEVLASNANAVQLFRIGRNLGTQFHMEVDRAHVKTWVDMAGPLYMTENHLDGAALIEEAGVYEQQNRVQCRNLVQWFLTEVASLT